MDNKVSKLKRKLLRLHGNKKSVYRINHPAFAKWKIKRDYTFRLKAILKHVGKVKGKRILDIGCCQGAYCHELAKMGAKVVGIDSLKNRIGIAKAISELYGLPKNNPAFYAIKYEEYLKVTKHIDRHFNITLFLSIFHHHIRGAGFKTAWQRVNLISHHTDVMFMELSIKPVHCKHIRRLGYKQSQMRQAIPQLVVKHTAFKHFKDLLPKRRRPLYAFTK